MKPRNKLMASGVGLAFMCFVASAHASPVVLRIPERAFETWVVGSSRATAERRLLPLRLEVLRRGTSPEVIVWTSKVEEPSEVRLSVEVGASWLYVERQRSGIVTEYEIRASAGVGSGIAPVEVSLETLPIRVAAAGQAIVADTEVLRGRPTETGLLPGQILLHFRPGTSLAARFAVFARHHLDQGGRSYWSPRTCSEDFLAMYSDARPIATVLDELRHDESVVWASPNFLLHPTYIPREFRDLAEMEQLQWAFVHTKSYLAWDVERASVTTPSIIALVDDGVALDHPALRNKLWVNDPEDLNHNGILDASDLDGVDQDGNGPADDVNGWAFTAFGIGESPDPRPTGTNEAHGTEMAGILGAEMDDAGQPGDLCPACSPDDPSCLHAGTPGLCPTCAVGFSGQNRIMALKVAGYSAFAINRAYQYALDMQPRGVRVVNASFGASSELPSTQGIIDALWAANVAVVAAAGNERCSLDAQPQYPACLDHVVAVAASTESDGVWDSGCQCAPNCGSNYGSRISVAAPGDRIHTSDWGDPLGGYYSCSIAGTSPACAVVSALTGMLFALNPAWQVNQVVGQILQTADPGPTGRNDDLGAGRINLARATGADKNAYWADTFGASPLNGAVFALAEFNGALVAGGEFTTAGSAAVAHIARWNGTDWLPLGAGVNGTVYTLGLYQGMLVAGGSFTQAGSTAANNVAAWDGTQWHALGAGVTGSFAGVLATTMYGDHLVVGGRFEQAGGSPASNIAWWNGSAWAPLGGGTTGTVRALTVYLNNLIAAGSFSRAGGLRVNCVARWDGTAWWALGSGLGDVANALTVYDGNLIAGGASGEGSASGVTRWDGTAWIPLDVDPTRTGYQEVQALQPLDGTLVAAGDFRRLGGITANRLARWTGAGWERLGSGVGGPDPTAVYALGVHGNLLVVGGSFASAGTTAASRVASWAQTPVPVEVSDLAVQAIDGGLRLSWSLSDAARAELRGVVVERAPTVDGPYQAVSPSPLEPAAQMRWDDTAVPAGETRWYRLDLVDRDGAHALAGPVRGTAGPGGLATTLSVPTMWNRPSLPIRYVVPRSSTVRLDVYDVAGRRVRGLVRATRAAGAYTITWDGRDDSGVATARGLYFVRLDADGTRLSKKVILLSHE